MNNLGIIDVVYLFLVVLFITIGIVCLWQKANKKRKQSIDDYFEGKRRRDLEFEKRSQK